MGLLYISMACQDVANVLGSNNSKKPTMASFAKDPETEVYGPASTENRSLLNFEGGTSRESIPCSHLRESGPPSTNLLRRLSTTQNNKFSGPVTEKSICSAAQWFTTDLKRYLNP